jgi:hypothetical protein
VFRPKPGSRKADSLAPPAEAHLRLLRGEYVEVETGEWIPSSLDALESMWMRWTYGSHQVFCKYAKKIFSSKNLLPLERFDLLAFVSAYGATAVFYPLTILWILFLSPAHTSALTFLILYLPTSLAAIVVYQRCLRALDVPFSQKLWRLFVGYFVIEPFIFLVSLKATYNYVTGKPQGWKVTAKQVEATPTWAEVIGRHSVAIIFGVSILAAIALSWGVRFDFSLTALVQYLPTALMASGLLLCVALYGREGRNAENAIASSTIDAHQARRVRDDVVGAILEVDDTPHASFVGGVAAQTVDSL